MPINTDEEAYANFNHAHLAQFLDNFMLMPSSIIFTPVDGLALLNTTTEDNDADQQSVNVPSSNFALSPIPTGSTVSDTTAKQHQIATVTNSITATNGTIAYTIPPINNKTTATATSEELAHIRPEPANIPTSPSDVDFQLMMECVSSD